MKSAKDLLDTVLPENINEYEWLTTGNLREKLEALVLAGMNSDRWISVDEKPKEYRKYLVLRKRDNYEVIDISFYNVQKEIWQYDAVSSFTITDVTHWQELPKIPNTK